MSREDRASAEKLKAVQQAIRDLGSVHADPAFRSRLRERFVTGSLAKSTGTEVRRGWLGRLRGWMLVPAAAAVAATIWLLLFAARPTWEFYNVTGTGSVIVFTGEETGAEVLGNDTTRLARLIRPGVRVRLEQRGTLEIIAGDALLFQLDNQAALTLPRNPRKGRVMVTHLEAGELRIKTGPGFTDQRLSVRTTEGRAELTGTVVSVFKGTDFTCVCVLEGTARIGKDEATLEDVPPGMRKVMYVDERPSIVAVAETHHVKDLAEFDRRTRDVFD